MPPVRIVSVLLVLLAGTSAASAQSLRSTPMLFHAFPAGGRSGSTVEVVIAGIALDSADALWFSNPGITAIPMPGQAKTFRVTIANPLSPGNVDIRALTPDGVSNPRTFVVGSRPESNESEPNDGLSTANPLTINSVMNGTIGPVDVDCFAFDGKEGQRLTLQVAAERIESKLDATLRLFNAQRVELAESRDTFGADPFLDVTLPYSGHYYIKVHDVTYQGSPEHFYRLTIDDGPRVDAIFPPIAANGEARTFLLIGRNLGEPPRLGPTFDGRFLETKERTFSPDFHSTIELPINFRGSSAALRGHVVGETRDGRLSNPTVLTEADGPVVAEFEPNSLEMPQEVKPPCAIGGDFRTAGDIDTYRFQAKKGDVWRIEAIAEGIGSPADPIFTLQRVTEKGDPADLLTADDTPDPGLSPRFNLASIDATVRWVVPEEGTYQVVLNDVTGSSRSGPGLFYRLSIRRERPGFRLFVVPTVPNALDSVTVRQGGRSSAIVLAWRLDGFTGPIWVLPSDLPPGVRCEPVVIPAAQTFATIVFEADANAKPAVGVVKLIGLASIKEVTRPPEGSGIEAWTGFELRSDAIPGSAIWPPVKLPNSQRTPAALVRATRGFVVAVRGGSPFRLSTQPKRSVVALGQSIDLDLRVDRSPGSDEVITLAAPDLPANFTPPTGQLDKGVDATQVAWTVPKTVAPGVYSLVLRGNNIFRPDSSKPAFKVDEPSNPFIVMVRPAPLTVSTATKPTIKPGEMVDIEVKIDRQGKFTGPVSLKLDATPASKLQADPVTVPTDRLTSMISLRSAKESPVGPHVATLRAEVVVDSEPIEIALPLDVIIAKP